MMRAMVQRSHGIQHSGAAGPLQISEAQGILRLQNHKIIRIPLYLLLASITLDIHSLKYLFPIVL